VDSLNHLRATAWSRKPSVIWRGPGRHPRTWDPARLIVARVVGPPSRTRDLEEVLFLQVPPHRQTEKVFGIIEALKFDLIGRYGITKVPDAHLVKRSRGLGSPLMSTERVMPEKRRMTRRPYAPRRCLDRGPRPRGYPESAFQTRSPPGRIPASRWRPAPRQKRCGKKRRAAANLDDLVRIERLDLTVIIVHPPSA